MPLAGHWRDKNMLREFEGLIRRVFRKGDKDLPEALRDAHRIDVFTASMTTELGIGQGLNRLSEELNTLDKMMDDPEVRAEWGKLFDAECKSRGRGLNFYERSKLKREAQRIVQEKRSK